MFQTPVGQVIYIIYSFRVKSRTITSRLYNLAAYHSMNHFSNFNIWIFTNNSFYCISKFSTIKLLKSVFIIHLYMNIHRSVSRVEVIKMDCSSRFTLPKFPRFPTVSEKIAHSTVYHLLSQLSVNIQASGLI